MTDAIAHVTVGVADLQPVFALWVDRFGLEMVSRRRGPDADLATLLGVAPGQIADQVLLKTPGASTGWLHFVEFSAPAEPVRAGAAVTDLGPKNLDVNCREMPARHAELLADGLKFRSAISQYEVAGIKAREVQMFGHDQTNIVLIEVLSEGFDMAMTPMGYGGLTSFVVIVPDTQAEADFYQQVFGFDELMHHRLSGPAIEQAVGVAPGTVLDMRLLGREAEFFGRMELIAYEGYRGNNLFARAIAPATGILGCGFRVASIGDMARRVCGAGMDVMMHEGIETLYGTGTFGVLHSPAGLRIELYQG